MSSRLSRSHRRFLNTPVRHTAGLAIALLTICSGEALAQSGELPQIVIFANQAPTDASKVGTAVTVITGDQLRTRGYTTVADALRSVPGVTVTQSGTRGSLTGVSIRGADTRHLLVMIDGIEVNQLGFPGFDFADLPVDDIERIEVLRGPQSGIYGANANAGVISIVTRSGRGLAHPVVDVKLEGGSRNTASGFASFRGAAGPFYGALSVEDYSTRGYNISRFGNEPDGSRAFNLTAKGGVDFNQYFNVEGVVRYTNRNAQTDPQDFNCNFPPPSFACVPANPSTYGLVADGNAASRYVSTATRVGATLTLLDGHWIQNTNVKLFDEHTRGFDNGVASFGADGTRTTVDYKSTVLFDSQLIGGEHHTVSLFIENRRENYQQLFSDKPYAKERTGLAGEYLLDLPTNTTVSAAVRQDWNSGFEDVLTWRFTISQRFPATGTRFHASIGKGVTEPDVFALFGSTFNLPNPNLLPEQSIGRDAGVEQTWADGRIVTDVTYFSTDFRNKIELTFDPVTFQGIYVNGKGIATRRGVEIANTFKVFAWLSMTATYTYTDAKDSFGVEEIRRPPHAAALDATARFLDDKAKASIGVVYNGNRTDYQFIPTGTTVVVLPGATVVRGMLSYDVTKWATVYIRGENVFNARYEEVFSYRAQGAAIYAGIRGRFTSD